MKRMVYLIFFSVSVIIILKSTTLGWRFWGKSFIGNGKENAKLAAKLKQHVYRLSHEIGDRSLFNYENLNHAAKYISQAFESSGYSLELQKFDVSNKIVSNIIVSKKGINRPEEIIILGAHYDTCFNPGADDNASAVAGLLEIARLIFDKQTNCSIKFIAFVNEEPPFFKTEEMGSRVYARMAKREGEDIKAVLILEMIGYYSDRPYSQRYPLILGPFYPNKANFIAVVGNLSSRGLVKKVVSNFKDKTEFPIESVVMFSFIPGIDFSDHWSFWKEGYPAVMITDTAFYRSPYYHSSLDTYEKLNYDNMAELVRGLSSALIELAQ